MDNKKPGGRLPHLCMKWIRWGLIFSEVKERKLPDLIRLAFIFGEIVLIFLFASIYLLVKAQTPQEISKQLVSNTNLTMQDIKAKNFPFLIQWPIEGKITQDFSSNHKGLDIQATYGSKIKPFGPGKVIETGYKVGYGYIILIKHKDSLSSMYAHLAKIQVKENQLVGLATEIGNVGTTGWTTGAHLHLEIYEEGKAIDPKNLLP